MELLYAIEMQNEFWPKNLLVSTGRFNAMQPALLFLLLSRGVCNNIYDDFVLFKCPSKPCH